MEQYTLFYQILYIFRLLLYLRFFHNFLSICWKYRFEIILYHNLIDMWVHLYNNMFIYHQTRNFSWNFYKNLDEMNLKLNYNLHLLFFLCFHWDLHVISWRKCSIINQVMNFTYHKHTFVTIVILLCHKKHINLMCPQRDEQIYNCLFFLSH